MLNAIKIAILAVASALLVGCATPASFQAMTVNAGESSTKTNEQLKGQIKVRNVTGGKDTNPLWTSQVDANGFKSALEQSIANAGYQGPANGAKYFLDAELQDLNQPVFGFTMDVQSTVSYKLTSDGASQSIPVTAKGSASPSDAFVGSERLRLANERSIKENIKALLQRLSDITLP